MFERTIFDFFGRVIAGMVCILRRYHRHHPDEELEFSLCPVTKMFSATNDGVSSRYCDFKGGPG